MFGMTMTTAEIRIVMHQRAMHGRDIAHLLSDACMTDRATIRHGRRFPRRRVTCFTIPTHLGMRGHPTQRLTAACAQWTRVVHQAPARISIARDKERGDQCGQNSRCR